MNWADILILTTVATAVAVVCRSLFRKPRGGCGCGCQGCGRECHVKEGR